MKNENPYINTIVYNIFLEKYYGKRSDCTIYYSLILLYFRMYLESRPELSLI